MKKGYGMSLTKLSVGGKNYFSRPGRVWLVTFPRLGTGKRLTFFNSVEHADAGEFWLVTFPAGDGKPANFF